MVKLEDIGGFPRKLNEPPNTTQHVAVRIETGGDATHTGEELKGTWGPNRSGGTKKSTRLTNKYVLWGKTKKVKL